MQKYISSTKYFKRKKGQGPERNRCGHHAQMFQETWLDSAVFCYSFCKDSAVQNLSTVEQVSLQEEKQRDASIIKKHSSKILISNKGIGPSFLECYFSAYSCLQMFCCLRLCADKRRLKLLFAQGVESIYQPETSACSGTNNCTRDLRSLKMVLACQPYQVVSKNHVSRSNSSAQTPKRLFGWSRDTTI